MTINSQISTVAAAIAGLTISGVTIKDIDEIPESAVMLCPLLLPQPNGYVSNLNIQFQTFGVNGTFGSGTPFITTTYTLNYVYLHCPVSSGLGAFAPYADIINKLELILETIASNNVITGAVSLKIESVGDIGVIPDYANNEFWGILFALQVEEYTQA